MKNIMCTVLLSVGLAAIASPVKSVLAEKESVVFSEGWENPYITDGLIAMWDGEWNAGGGVHNMTLPAPVNLAGTDIELNMSGAPFIWSSNAMIATTNWADSYTYYDPPRYPVTTKSVNVDKVTIEVCLKSETVYRWFCAYPWMQPCEAWRENSTGNMMARIGTFRIGIAFPTYWRGYVRCCQVTYDRSIPRGVFRRVLGIGRTDIIQQDAGGSVGNQILSLSSNMRGGDKLFAIRIYNRALTTAELKHNSDIDMMRFNELP